MNKIIVILLFCIFSLDSYAGGVDFELLAKIDIKLMEKRILYMQSRISELNLKSSIGHQLAHGHKVLLQNNQLIESYGLSVAEYQRLRSRNYDDYQTWLMTSSYKNQLVSLATELSLLSKEINILGKQ